MKLLLVEDDSELRQILSQGFAEHGIRTSMAATFERARSLATEGMYDAIVLDVLLPGGDGFRLCEMLRKAGVTTPILMLTALDAVMDRVRGLECGADDYLAKPFEFRELLARVNALARRPPLASKTMKIADLEIDFVSHRVRRGGKAVTLTAKEYALLELFTRHAGRVLDRPTITAHVWDENHDPFTNVLEVLIRRLRGKIDDGFTPKLIQTIRGSGYRFGLP